LSSKTRPASLPGLWRIFAAEHIHMPDFLAHGFLPGIFQLGCSIEAIQEGGIRYQQASNDSGQSLPLSNKNGLPHYSEK
jgi:hypothetical protein